MPVLLLDVFKGWVSVNYIVFLSEDFIPISGNVTSTQFEIQLLFGMFLGCWTSIPNIYWFQRRKRNSYITWNFNWIKFYCFFHY